MENEEMIIEFGCNDSVWDNDILYHCDPLHQDDRDRDEDENEYDDEPNWIDEYYEANRELQEEY